MKRTNGPNGQANHAPAWARELARSMARLADAMVGAEKRAEEDRKRADEDRKRADEDRLWFKEQIQEMRAERRTREKEFARVLVTVGNVGARILRKLDEIHRDLRRSNNGRRTNGR